MKTFWLFRSNLRQYEYYHSIDNLEQFKKECHDFYLLMGIWMLENTELQEFVVWRSRPRGDTGADRVFDVNGKKFIQKFTEFEYCFNYPGPDVTFFRGGFPEYAKLTNAHASHFGLKLYYGAGRRTQPQYGGVYDKVLVEDERDYAPNTIPFYKTANPNIFFPMELEKKWDICWPCNFAQLKYKGQEWFIEQVAKSDYLKSLKILHVGNVPKIGKELCRKYGVNNIIFKGAVTRPELNKFLNQSKIGLVSSNNLDGSPRMITEIVCSGIPLVKRQCTRHIGNVYWHEDTDIMLRYMIQNVVTNYQEAVHDQLHGLPEHKGWSMDFVCKKNLELWK